MRSIKIDILRGLAILLVLGAHIPEDLLHQKGFLSPILSLWMKCGWSGVDLFFVISGFLVSGLLFREFQIHGSVDIKRFFIRRGMKIYPAFYAFLLIVFIFFFARGITPYSLAQYGAELFYVQNYAPHVWEHTWSLAVEEHFYLLLGLLIAFCTRKRGKDPFAFLIFLSGAIAFVILLLRTLNAALIPYQHQTHLFPTHLRVDSLFFGVLLSYLHHFRREGFEQWVGQRKWFILGGSVLCLSTLLRFTLFDVYMHSIGFTLVYLGYGGVLALALYCVKEETFKNNILAVALARVGVYSYSIYLWHIILARHIPYVVIPSVPLPMLWPLVNLGIYLLGSITAGVVMAKLVELPFLQVRDRVFVSRCSVLDK